MASYGSVDKGGEREPFLKSEVNRFILETTPISWFDSLTFNWFAPLLERGNKKDQLDPQDLETIPLPESCKTSNISDRFEDEWNKEVRRAQKQTTSFQEKQPSLGLALARAFGRDFIRAGFLKLIHDCGVFVGPAVLHGFIEFLRDEDAPLSRGFYLTAAVALSQTAMSFCLRHYFFKCYLTGLKMRSAIVLAVYKKALLLSSAARHNRSGGEIINFMTSDANRIQQLTTYLHAVWYSFLQISLAIYFLWQQVGPSCLGGAAVICIMIPVNKVIAGWMGYLQKKLMKARDHRVEMNSEVLSNMKVIKLQAWEDSFQNRITDLRNKELKQLFYYVVANCFSMMMWTAVPILVAVATFATYTLTGNKLDVANALTALALFDILRFPLFMLPQVINNLVEASVSFNRVREFLLSEEHLSVSEGYIVDSSGVNIDNASFVYDSKKPRMVLSPELEKVGNRKMLTNLHNKDWEISLLKSQLKDLEIKLKDFSAEPKNENDPLMPKMESGNMSTLEESSENDSLLSLRRVNLDIHPGEMIAVVGAVGAGKSTLVNSILGEVRSLSGNVSAKGRLAYFPQMPFIMNDTVKRNITFARQNEAFDEMRYKKALSVCALEHDLSLLSGGDETEIGEKGV
jgi:ABC-type multidrug transport system fused ATPase/permease subunit